MNDAKKVGENIGNKMNEFLNADIPIKEGNDPDGDSVYILKPVLIPEDGYKDTYGGTVIDVKVHKNDTGKFLKDNLGSKVK